MQGKSFLLINKDHSQFRVFLYFCGDIDAIPRFLPAVCTIFPIVTFLQSYNVFTQSVITVFEARFKSLPSTICASGADGCNSFTVLPNPLPPDVANNTIFFPAKSCASKKVLIMVGATYHQIGKPNNISSYSSIYYVHNL